MNYIQEINAFYVWLIENPLPANCQALWHRLMAYCNQFCWKSDFTVSNTRLLDELGMTRTSFNRARNILIQSRLIRYKPGKGNQCGIYTINSIANQKQLNFGTQSEHSAVHSAYGLRHTKRTQCGQSVEPLDKPNVNKTKRNKGESAPARAKSEPDIEREPAVQFAENVTMTNAEHEKLLGAYGEADTARLIEILDNYKGSTGKKYKNDYRAILSWCVERLQEKKGGRSLAGRQSRAGSRASDPPESEHSFDIDKLEKWAFDVTYGDDDNEITGD